MSRSHSDWSELTIELQDRSVEAAILGGMMLSPDAIDTVVGILQASDFLISTNGMLFSVMSKMRDRGQAVDAVTLCEQLVADGLLAEVGGAQAIAELLEIVPHAQHSAYYANIVLENSRRRKFRRLADEIRASSEDRTVPVQDLAGQVTSQVDRICGGGSGDTVVSGRQAVEMLQDRLNNPLQTIPTGLKDLDAVLRGNGIPRAALTCLFARPSMGKSSLMTSIFTNAARRGHRSLVFSLEMPVVELMERVWVRGHGAEQEFNELGVFFDEETDNLDQMKSVMRRMIRRENITCCYIDYCDFITLSNKRLRGEEKIEEITIGLKKFAKKEKVGIVLLCQANRKVEEGDDKRPTMGNIRGSSRFEQDSDLIIAPHRPCYYDKSADENMAEILVLKQRGGARNEVIKVGYRAKETQFVDYSNVAENVADGFDL